MKIRVLVLVSVGFTAGLVPTAGVAAETLGRLLMSTAWCSVRPAPDGHRIRIVFHADGHYVLTGDHRGNEGHWKVTGRTLHMAEKDKALEPVASEVRRPRRGQYLVFVDGEEFVRCK